MIIYMLILITFSLLYLHLFALWHHSPTYSQSSCLSQWFKYPSHAVCRLAIRHLTHCHRATLFGLYHAFYRLWTRQSILCRLSIRIHHTLRACYCSSHLCIFCRLSIEFHLYHSCSCRVIHLHKWCLISILNVHSRVFCHLCSHRRIYRRCWTSRSRGLISYL